jgi:hypothetical protein
MAMEMLFVMGCQRSGTTMLQQALNRHSQIVIPPETGFFIDFLGHTRTGQRQHVRRINEDLGIRLPEPARRISRAAEAREFYEWMARMYLGRLGRPGVAYFGEKTPHHFLRIRRVSRLYPRAKMIFLYRDGRDVALSLTRVHWMSPDLYVNFAHWLRSYRVLRRAQMANPGNLLCIKYESLVTEPESQLRNAAEFLSLSYEPAMAEGSGNREGIPEWEYGWKSRALDKITPARVARWRGELSPGDIMHLERWGGTALKSLGYELVTDGNQRLPVSFFPRLRWKQLLWLAGGALQVAAKDLFGRDVR